MKHIVLDLETLSTENNALILSIGAVKIKTGDENKIEEKFYRIINLESSMKYDFHISAGTLKWWFSMDKKLIEKTFTGIEEEPVSIENALNDFSTFCNIDERLLIWGNSNSFDCTIIENAYKTLGLPCPFMFYQTRDFRTMKALFKSMSPEFSLKLDNLHYSAECSLIAHNALDDAILEAEILLLIIGHLKSLGLNILEF